MIAKVIPVVTLNVFEGLALASKQSGIQEKSTLHIHTGPTMERLLNRPEMYKSITESKAYLRPAEPRSAAFTLIDF